MKSQWDFSGELFPPEQLRKVLSVTELTARIRRLLEENIGEVWVSGELTNLRLQASGHMYFTLKDAGSQVSCVLFRGEPGIDRSFLQDGRKVTVCGQVTVYEPRGQYQLRITKVEAQGVGALQAAFEKLKQKLNAAGWFSQERKRALPRFPQRIGLVTSTTGAAIRDVLHVVQRRNPALEIILAPCRVQGDGAAQEIAAAIRDLNRFSITRPDYRLDLLLVVRGGGSLEDLWAFNEEALAKTIFESALPVVSGIGHEIDFTICDFVADLRAATPSAAAEIITEGVFSSCRYIAEAAERIRLALQHQRDGKVERFKVAAKRLGRLHPRRVLQERLQRLDDLQASLVRCTRRGLQRQRAAAENLAQRLSRVRPLVLLKQRREVLGLSAQRLQEQARHRLREWKNRVDGLTAQLRLLGPDQVLARGYSITFTAESGKVLRQSREVKPGQRLKTRLHEGEISSRVEE